MLMISHSSCNQHCKIIFYGFKRNYANQPVVLIIFPCNLIFIRVVGTVDHLKVVPVLMKIGKRNCNTGKALRGALAELQVKIGF